MDTSALPTGTVTFLLTDIEGSTRLWEQHPDAMRRALARHDALAAAIIEQHAGVLIKSRGEGDSLFAVFPRATDALASACALQQALLAEPWPTPTPLRVRLALHTGEAELREGDYFGPAVNRCARLRAAAHGGQVLLSMATEELVRETLPEAASLYDRGLIRLRDLAHPEHVFQLAHPDLPAEFPPLRSLEAFSHNLPAQLTSFIGREQEMAEAKQWLATTRLLTLTGSGGCGKTRLALQVAVDLLEEYTDGVWLVELAPLADPALVPQMVASALGVREQAGRPLTETLVDYLKPRALLLLLDNCEHLLAACAQMAESLLRACPQLRILASSREGLGIAGELSYRVPSLSAPDPRHLPTGGPELVSALLQYEAVRLFHERARFVQPHVALTPLNAPAVAQVCHRLDGIPLAIELAAARIKVLPVEQIAARLDDRFRLLTGGSRTALPRQQTLRALIDWSYDLLSPPERVLLRRLSVFAGGWTLEAAEAVCVGEEIDAWDVLDLLMGLVDKSLVMVDQQQGEARYRLLETVRQYARDKLLEAGESEATRGRHADYFLDFATKVSRDAWLARTSGSSADPCTRVESLKEEHDNFRAALDWCKGDPNGAERGLRLIRALWWWWFGRSKLREGFEYLTCFLAREEVAGDSPERAGALNGAGFLAGKQGNLTAARSLLEQSVEMGRRLGLEAFVGEVLNNLGDVASDAGDYAAARGFYEESLRIRRERGYQWGIGWSLIHLGRLARLEGDDERAAALDHESLGLFRAVGNPGPIAWALNELGRLSQAQREYAAARSYYRESLTVSRDMGETPALPSWLETFAALTAAQGEPERGARLHGAAERLREVRGTPVPASERDEYARNTAAMQAALGEAAFTAAWAEGRAMTLEDALAYALEEAPHA